MVIFNGIMYKSVIQEQTLASFESGRNLLIVYYWLKKTHHLYQMCYIVIL